MAIWFQTSTLEQLNARNANTLIEHLDIRFTEIGEDYLKAEMPVDHRTVQPLGLLHGGASVALAETLGSIAANLVVDRSRKVCLGLEINANHLKSAKSGKVIGTVRPFHIGASTQVWSIEIRNEEGQLTCISRITMAVLDVK